MNAGVNLITTRAAFLSELYSTVSRRDIPFL